VIPHAIYRGTQLLGFVRAADELDALREWVRASGIEVTREGDVIVVADEHYDAVCDIRAERMGIT
jgi:hypothetical protein